MEDHYRNFQSLWNCDTEGMTANCRVQHLNISNIFHKKDALVHALIRDLAFWKQRVVMVMCCCYVTLGFSMPCTVKQAARLRHGNEDCAMLQNVWSLPILSLFVCLWLWQSPPYQSSPFLFFFHPSSPHLNFPVYFTPLLFLSHSYLPLILCPFIKTTKKLKRIQRKLLIVWLQIPQCHQVVHKIMAAFEKAYCINLFYMLTQSDDGSVELENEG